MSIIAPAYVHDAADNWHTVFFQRVLGDGTIARVNTEFTFNSDHGSTLAGVELVNNQYTRGDEYALASPYMWMKHYGSGHGGVMVIVGYVPRLSTPSYAVVEAQINVPYSGYPDSIQAFLEGKAGSMAGARTYPNEVPYTGFDPSEIILSRFNKPQLRALTIVKDSFGNCAYGLGHPEYTKKESGVWEYTDIGKIGYASDNIDLRPSKTLTVESVGLPITFIEVKVQNSYSPAEFDFSNSVPEIEAPNPWWQNKHYVKERLQTAAVVTDFRGFPI